MLGFVTRTRFKTGPPGLVGVESEWFVHGRPRPVPTRLPSAPRPHSIRCPAGSLLTFEPGGQLELSTAALGTLGRGAATCCDRPLPRRRGCARAGLRLVGAGVDQPAGRGGCCTTPRYAAMETYFDRDGPAGRAMMPAPPPCRSASTPAPTRPTWPAAGGARQRARPRCWSRPSPTRRCTAGPPDRLALAPGRRIWCRHRPGPHRPPGRARTRRAPGREYALDAPRDARPARRRRAVAGRAGHDIPRVGGGRPRCRPTDRRRPRLPPDHAVPAGAAAWLARAAHDRRAARRAVAGRAWPSRPRCSTTRGPPTPPGRDAPGSTAGRDAAPLRGVACGTAGLPRRGDRVLRCGAHRPAAARRRRRTRGDLVDAYADRYVATGRTPADDLLATTEHGRTSSEDRPRERHQRGGRQAAVADELERVRGRSARADDRRARRRRAARASTPG